MKNPPFQRRTLALLVVLLPLLALFVYVALRSGPLAPIPVTVVTVEERSIAPGLFGIGTVEALYTYRIGPTFAGRVKRVDVQVGDRIKAGQIIGEMDPVDLDERIRAQEAAYKRTEAQLHEAMERQTYSQAQARRYEKLLTSASISEETVATKKYELRLADAGLNSAREELTRVRAEGEALVAQRNNLHLVAPVDGLVTVRYADPGTTVVTGQAVVELIDPTSLWVNVRFDQIHARGLVDNLAAQIVLRSQSGESRAGRVVRVEPLADSVTEEIMAKVVFEQLPDSLPPVGELAEVTITLPTLPESPVIPNAAIHHIDGRLGVWQVTNGDLHFTPVSLGTADLDGYTQVREGLEIDDQVVLYSANGLHARSRIHIVDHIGGVKR
ncbi:MAG: efflux RND transporter periplasmic adaptor subunit [Pseudomonadota bacterium]